MMRGEGNTPVALQCLPVLALLAGSCVAGELCVANPLRPVYEGPDLSAKDDAQVGIRLAGARGGSFSGQVVVFFGTSAKGPEAAVSDLKSKDGGSIPASAIEVRYALPTGVNGIERLPAGTTGIFDALDVKPRDEGAAHPVWVTVNVPREAAPGEYGGKLSVAGGEVPVNLSVAAWTLPKPEDYVTWADFVESPESVALRYNVKLWSDEHWKLIGKSFEQLAKVGNKTLYIPLMCQTHFGNSESMVRWVKGETEREFKHDFSIAEKYVDICIEHAGKPRIVVLYVYEGFLGGSQGRSKEEWERGVPFTLLDPKTGDASTASGPTHNNANPAYPDYPKDTIDFWKPVVDGMRERLKARGIGDECIALGISNDLQPGQAQMNYMKTTFPYARWCHQGHGLVDKQRGAPVAYETTVWQAAFAKSPTDRQRGWIKYRFLDKSLIVAMFDRDIWKPDYRTQLVRSRMLGELNITGCQRGFGRMSADFWPCLKDGKGRLHPIVNRYPLSNWNQLSLRMTPYLYPGRDGALSTIRYEMLREGVQECEARIFVEKALLDQDSRAKMGEELAKKVQDVLDERVTAILDSMKKGSKGQGGLQGTAADFADGPWRERSLRLYAAAAEVGRVLGGPGASAGRTR